MNRGYLHIALAFLMLLLNVSCVHSSQNDTGSKGKNGNRVITKRRDDGTLSSINQVDEEGRVNGVRVTYYADGKTIHSKLTFSHGIKEGPSIRYYNNGQIFEHTGFKDGEKDGPTRKYYKDGKLLSECTYKDGNVLPGLKEYNEDGSLITSYPEIRFREIDRLKTFGRYELEMSCAEKNRGIKYFLISFVDLFGTLRAKLAPASATSPSPHRRDLHRQQGYPQYVSHMNQVRMLLQQSHPGHNGYSSLRCASW